MKIFYSFIIVGFMCAIASLIYDLTRLSAGHITSLYVILGTILGIFGIYDKLIEKFGYGLTTPIISFGNSLVNSSYNGFKKEGFIGLFDYMYNTTSAGIAGAIILSFIVSLMFKPKN